MRERIAAALKAATETGDETRVATLRLILAALKDRSLGAEPEEGEAPDDERAGVEILSKMIRQREESARDYEEAGRLELAERERAEMEVAREFLPPPMSEQEIDAAVADAITHTEARSIRDMGRVMGALKARHGGRMDFCAVGPRVRDRLH
jgi:uncharacterized protein YqeY